MNGESLEYIVTDNNINECDYFQELSMRRYWFFRFSLFHKLKFYLKKDCTDFKQDVLNNLSASETNDSSSNKPEDLEQKETEPSPDNENNKMMPTNEKMGTNVIEHTDIKETVPEEEIKYYTLSDDELLKENEQTLKEKLEKFKNNNIVKAAILEDFKPILLTRSFGSVYLLKTYLHLWRNIPTRNCLIMGKQSSKEYQWISLVDLEWMRCTCPSTGTVS